MMPDFSWLIELDFLDRSTAWYFGGFYDGNPIATPEPFRAARFGSKAEAEASIVEYKLRFAVAREYGFADWPSVPILCPPKT